jgi:ATP-dependent DNA helicase RecG
MGVPRKIVRLMRENNGTEPDLIEDAERFTVRLWKGALGGGGAAVGAEA